MQRKCNQLIGTKRVRSYFKIKSYDIKVCDLKLVSSELRVVPCVNVGGAETGQLLAELLCPWLLGFCPAPSAHNGTLSRTAANVHTCFYICGHMHTHRDTHGAHTCKTRVLERAHTTHMQTHARRNTNSGDMCCSTCSQWATPAALLMSFYAQLHSHAHISITTTAYFTQTWFT